MTGRIKSVKNIRTFEGIPAEEGRVIASSAFIRRDRRMAEKVRAAYRADERYLRAMIDAVSRQCGSVESFFRDRLGISDEERERFRSNVLADCW